MTAQGRCGAELAWSSPKAGLRGALRMSPPGATPRLPADGPDRVNLRRTTHGQRQMSAFAPTAHHTVGMNRPAMLSLAIVGLAVSACGSTRHVNTAGCVSEVKFHNVAYCSYGDVTGTKQAPTHAPPRRRATMARWRGDRVPIPGGGSRLHLCVIKQSHRGDGSQQPPRVEAVHDRRLNASMEKEDRDRAQPLERTVNISTHGSPA
jgi:hypothetical protein